MNFSEALKEMKKGAFVKRDDSPYIYCLKDSSFSVIVGEYDVDRMNPILEYHRPRNGFYIIPMFEYVRHTDNFCAFDDEDLLHEGWTVVDCPMPFFPD